VEEGLGPRAVLDRLRRGEPARAALPDLVDYEFTARMEDDLDGIAVGEEERCRGSPASTSATAMSARG
jgi:hypothetical protein